MHNAEFEGGGHGVRFIGLVKYDNMFVNKKRTP